MRENPGCVVTKYQFSHLFSKAWYKAIQPNNLISGFAKTSIHPFNADAITVPALPNIEVDEGDDDDSDGSKIKDKFESPSTSGAGKEDSRSAAEEKMEDGSGKEGYKEEFTPSEIERFTTRYENGYDIYTDPRYVTWLVENYPDALPDEVRNSLCCVPIPFKVTCQL